MTTGYDPKDLLNTSHGEAGDSFAVDAEDELLPLKPAETGTAPVPVRTFVFHPALRGGRGVKMPTITPKETLERAYRIAKKKLKNVYLGNI